MSTICCCCSISKSCLNICDLTTAARQASPSFTITWSFFRFNLLNRWCYLTTHPLFPLSLLPSIFPSIRVFSNELALLIRWPTYWSFSISPSNGYPGLISFRIKGFDLLAVQRILYSVFWPCHMSCGIFIPQMIPARVLSVPWSTEVDQRPDRKFRQGFSGALLQLGWGGGGNTGQVPRLCTPRWVEISLHMGEGRGVSGSGWRRGLGVLPAP